MNGHEALRKSWLAGLLAALFLSGGCHTLFGEFEINDDPPSKPATLCSEGSFRCVGPWLYSCSDDLNGWTLVEACETEAHCDSHRGECLRCVPETHRCNSSRLEVCNQNGGWDLVEDCGSSDLCNLGSDSCRPCTPGEVECNLAVLRQCSQEQTWLELETCTNLASCVVNVDRRGGSCKEDACATGGTHVCNGAQLLRCTNARHRLIEIDTCASAESCNAGAADSQASQGLLGTCQPTCEPGALRCVGAELQRCDAPGTSWSRLTSCSTEAECSVTAGACVACSPGQVECNQAELRRCTQEGAWETLANCGSAEFCDADNRTCLERECPVPGLTECQPDGLRKCRLPNLEWDFLVFCPGDLCNANDGKCDSATCARNETRCANNAFQRCSDALTHWQTVEQCDEGETCGLSGCETEPCTTDTYRCNNVYLERCDEASTWQRIDRCATSELCNEAEGQCKPPECGGTKGDFRCLGTSLQRCSEDRTEWEDYDECSRLGLECDATTGTCRPPTAQ